MSLRPNASSLNRQGHETTDRILRRVLFNSPLVIPAQAGIQRLTNRFSPGRRGYGTFGSWIPACAGMTRGVSAQNDICVLRAKPSVAA